MAFPKDTGLALLGFLIIAAIVYGYINIETLSLDFASVKKDPTGFLLSSVGKAKSTVEFKATLTADSDQNLNFKFSEPTKVNLLFKNPNADFYIDKTSIKAEKNEIELRNYTGLVGIFGSYLRLDGSSNSLKVDSVTWNPQTKVSVVTDRLVYDDLVIESSQLLSYKLENVRGEIELKDETGTAKYQKTSGSLEISSFVGKMEFAGSRMIIEGKAFLKTETLQSPGG